MGKQFTFTQEDIVRKHALVIVITAFFCFMGPGLMMMLRYGHPPEATAVKILAGAFLGPAAFAVLGGVLVSVMCFCHLPKVTERVFCLCFSALAACVFLPVLAFLTTDGRLERFEAAAGLAEFIAMFASACLLLEAADGLIAGTAVDAPAVPEAPAVAGPAEEASRLAKEEEERKQREESIRAEERIQREEERRKLEEQAAQQGKQHEARVKALDAQFQALRQSESAYRDRDVRVRELVAATRDMESPLDPMVVVAQLHDIYAEEAVAK